MLKSCGNLYNKDKFNLSKEIYNNQLIHKTYDTKTDRGLIKQDIKELQDNNTLFTMFIKIKHDNLDVVEFIEEHCLRTDTLKGCLIFKKSITKEELKISNIQKERNQGSY